jgi:tetratricopeptide (TPR) repeat protein
LDPTSDDAFRGLADAYRRLNKPAEAEATYKRAISLRPQYWAVHNSLGFFYFNQGRYEDAAKMFRAVINLSPDNFRGYSNLGAMYVLQGRYQEAIGTLQRSVSLRPTGDAYLNLGTAQFNMRSFSEAAHSFEAALKLDTTAWLSWGNLADAYYWMPGKRPEAGKAYREAIRLADEKLQVNPKDGSTLAYRAQYLAMIDQKDDALATLHKAISFSPQDPDVLLRAALVYNHFGDTERTLEWLQKALTSGVSSEFVKGMPDFDRLGGDDRFQRLLREH